MKDIIFNAHYTPGYLYEPIICLGLPAEYDSYRDSDRVEEWCEYQTWHWPGSYQRVGHEEEKCRMEFAASDTKGSVTPNFPPEKYDTIARREWEEYFEEPWPYGDD